MNIQKIIAQIQFQMPQLSNRTPEGNAKLLANILQPLKDASNFQRGYVKGLKHGMGMGLAEAVRIKHHWKPNECDGVDALKCAIRKSIRKYVE